MAEVVLFMLLIGLCSGEIVLQTNQFCSICTTNEEFCRNPVYSKTKYRFHSRNEDEISSNVGGTYQDGRNCIVSIEALPNNQIEVQIANLAVDSNAVLDNEGYPVRCYDYIKLFNGPTVDNAKMFPAIPPSGICGKWTSAAEMSKLRSFRTSQNQLTIQFVTDSRKESYGGFRIHIKQYAYSNTGNLYPSGGNLGGWNDGSLNEFKIYWHQLNVIPGGIFPGTGGKDYGSSTSGISCYSCEYCPLEGFDPEGYGTGTVSGCHICSKEWDDQYRSARRLCYSEKDYNLLLQTLSLGQGGDKVERFTNCKKFVTQYGRTVNYCFCTTSECNKASGLNSVPTLLMLCVASLSFLFTRVLWS